MHGDKYILYSVTKVLELFSNHDKATYLQI